MKKFSKAYMALFLMFMYIPIFVLIVFSFNEIQKAGLYFPDLLWTGM